MKKQTNKTRTIDALNAALNAVYHNATVWKWADTIPGCVDFYDWLSEAATFEVNYLNDGGATGCTPYNLMQHVKDKAAAFKSDKARAYFLRMKHREYNRDRAAGIESRIRDHGELFTYGRGGRTLAPDSWAAGHHGFRAKRFEYDDLSAERAADMLRDVRDFNEYVRGWCDNAPAMYREDCISRLAELVDDARRELHSVNREALPLVREIKAAGREFSPSVCKVLTDALKSLLRQRGEAINALQSALNTLKGLQPCAN